MAPRDAQSHDGAEQWAAPWWGKAPIRLALLLAVLAVVAGYGAHRILKGTTAHTSAGCYPTTGQPPRRWSLGEVKRMVAVTGLRSLVGRGKLDIQGPQDPIAAWSDRFPSSASSRDPYLVPAMAGYEIRWWSPQNVHEAADVFVFRTAGDAAGYVRRAASLRCRRRGAVSIPIAEPTGARSLIWDNPEGYLQADVFFARANRAYRITEVPPGPHARPSAGADAWQLLKTPQQVACLLVDAGCETRNLYVSFP